MADRRIRLDHVEKGVARSNFKIGQFETSRIEKPSSADLKLERPTPKARPLWRSQFSG